MKTEKTVHREGEKEAEALLQWLLIKKLLDGLKSAGPLEGNLYIEDIDSLGSSILLLNSV